MNDSTDEEPSRKRLRQTTILESLGFCREEKRKMEPLKRQESVESKKMREKAASAAEKRILSSSTYDEFSGITPDKGQSSSEQLEQKLSLTVSSQDLPVESFCSDSSSSPLLFEDEPDAWIIGQRTDSVKFSREILKPSVPSEGHLMKLYQDSTSSGSNSSSLLRGYSHQQEDSATCSCGTPLADLRLDKISHGGHISPNHMVLFQLPFSADHQPCPYPAKNIDIWDHSHVRMPSSKYCLYPVEDGMGGQELKCKWNIIQEALKGPFHSSLELEEAILKYNTKQKRRWNFSGMHSFFLDVLDTSESCIFFDKLLPAMCHLALRLPELFTRPPPLLKKGKTISISFTQLQIASLLANAFFCTFPNRNSKKRDSEYYTFPDINFNRMFVSSHGTATSRKAEKLKCLLHYFRRVTTKEPCGTVTFKRQRIDSCPQWESSSTTLPLLHVSSRGTIEKDGSGMLQVDFANKFVGGGVLGQGCVQEEIRFIICPELIASRLICEVLESNECLIIIGAEQYCSYKGYADNFAFDGDFVDSTPRDHWGRRKTEIVAIDATKFSKLEDQYKPELLMRELKKAYCGFHYPDEFHKNRPAVATGNWGCGAFKGNARLKALLQLMAAAEAGRNVAYFTFGDFQLCKDIYSMYQYLVGTQTTVGELWNLLQHYYDAYCKGRRPTANLYEFIKGVRNGHNANVTHKIAKLPDLDTNTSKQSTSTSNTKQEGGDPIKELSNQAGHNCNAVGSNELNMHEISEQSVVNDLKYLFS